MQKKKKANFQILNVILHSYVQYTKWYWEAWNAMITEIQINQNLILAIIYIPSPFA